MAFYGSGVLYGSGVFYAPSGIDTPIELDFYRTDVDNSYVFHWTFQQAFMNPVIAAFDYELQLDTDSSFSSPNLATHETTTITSVIPAGPPYILTLPVTAQRVLIVHSNSVVFAQVTGTPAAGEYSVNLTTSVLTFNAADATVPVAIIFVEATSDDVTQFQRGCTVKGFAVTVPTRAESAEIDFYARVRIKNGMTYSGWSDTLSVSTIEDVKREAADRYLNALPDRNVYPVDEALIPIADRTSNISAIDETYAQESDLFYLEKEHTIRDPRPERVRDNRIFDVHGNLYRFPKPNSMEFVQYRKILKNMRAAVLVGGSYEALQLIGLAFTGVESSITAFSDLIDFITAGEIAESGTIPVGAPYEITLTALPRNVPVIPGYTFVDTAPSASGEFDVDFSTGIITFHSTDAGAAVTITYAAASTIHTHLKEVVDSLSVPGGAPYEVTLSAIPRSVPTIPGYSFTFGTPGVGEFAMDFSTGKLTFHSSAAGASITATYISSTTTQPVVFSRLEAGFSVKITLNNPANCSIDTALVSFLIEQIIPAHVNFKLELV